MVAFFGGFVKLLLVIIGLLSGVISIFREFQIMYWPPKAPHRKVFWAFVRVAFVISASLSWFNAFTAMKHLQSDLLTTQARAANAEHNNVVLQTKLEDATKNQPIESPDSLRRRAKKLADDIDKFWDETNATHLPRTNGRGDATGEQLEVNNKWDDYMKERERICLSKFGTQIVGIPKELATKGLPVNWLDKFEAGNNLRCLYPGPLGGGETEILRGLSYRLDARGNPVQF